MSIRTVLLFRRPSKSLFIKMIAESTSIIYYNQEEQAKKTRVINDDWLFRGAVINTLSFVMLYDGDMLKVSNKNHDMWELEKETRLLMSHPVSIFSKQFLIKTTTP